MKNNKKQIKLTKMNKLQTKIHKNNKNNNKMVNNNKNNQINNNKIIPKMILRILKIKQKPEENIKT